MRFSIAQIGQNRLKRVLINDKQNNPQKVCEVLKSDINAVADSYLENPYIEIESHQTDDGVVFEVIIKCTRVKSLGVLA